MATRSCVKLFREKLTKSEKRALRKHIAKINSLQRHNAELVISETPTSHLLISNGGLMNGVDRSHIVDVFKNFGIVERVIMVPQRSYSFVTFKNIEDASKAMQCIHGRAVDLPAELTEAGRVIFYLSYLKDIPDDVTTQKDCHPPGLVLIEGFVSEEMEEELLLNLGWNDEDDVESKLKVSSETVQKQLRHRKVKHFGYEFLYGTNNIDVSKPLPGGIPEVCNGIIECMVSSGYIKSKPDQLTVNEYSPGQGIPPHVDTHSAFDDGIVSLSLGAKIIMEFRHPDGRHVSVLLPRRSLLVMTGESRYQWTHGITPRKFDIIHEDAGSAKNDNTGNNFTDVGDDDSNDTATGVTQYKRETRLSLTFRKIRSEPCKCSYPKQCDSQNYKDTDPNPNYYTLPKTQQDAETLEATHVHEVYEKIADHFSDTRHSPWPKIADFLRGLPKGSLVADVGCGNGKYLGLNQDIIKTGSDRSFNLVSIAKERGHSVIVCDVLNLPYRSGAFDVSICIAVLHHLSTTERRLEGLRELVRIVRPGGLVLVYVWALEQKLEKIKQADLKEIEFSRGTKRENINKTDLPVASNEVSSVATSDTTNKDEKQIAQNVQVNMKREVFEQQDLFVPWKFRGNQEKKDLNSKPEEPTAHDKADSHVFHRFYHVFKEGELLNLCSHLDDVIIKELFYDRGNWCVLLEKKCD